LRVISSDISPDSAEKQACRLIVERAACLF
jgi:hypothetical protein